VGCIASFREGVAGWVHERARLQPYELVRHGDFIIARLMTALAMLALAPVYLALRGAPALWESLFFVCAALPLLSILILTRTGNYVFAQGLSASGMIAMAAAVSYGMGGLTAAGVAWLLLAPIEACFALSMPLLMATLCASLVALCAILLAGAYELIARDGGAGYMLHGMFISAAIIHAAALAFGGLRQLEDRRKYARIGAARFDTLAGVMGDVVLRHDRSGAVLNATGDSEAKFGVPAREFMGRGLFERILVQDRPAFLKAIADAAEGGTTSICELRLRTSSTASARGNFNEPVFIWIEMRARRLAHRGDITSDRDGACVLAVLRDIHREKARQQELEAARQEAERANAWKDSFLANVSHELRTPLNAIIGFSEMLGNEELMPKDAARRKEYADIVHSSGEHLLSVVNSILDISKMEAGSFDLLKEPFEVSPLVDSCCDMMSLKAEQSNVELVRTCTPNIGELTADRRACKQVIINLLSNALKFTPAGGSVTVGARVEGNSVAFYVADTGVGISPRDLPHLGDTFFQAGGAYNRRYEGTGLGLSVVRGLVGLHGGSIAIESSPDKGTCVTVLLARDGVDAALHRGAAPIEAISRIGSESSIHHSSANPVKKIA
jgi:cell cycle sensor histidine kinase DivJ